jgi:hypothetical protein
MFSIQEKLLILRSLMYQQMQGKVMLPVCQPTLMWFKKR